MAQLIMYLALIAGERRLVVVAVVAVVVVVVVVVVGFPPGLFCEEIEEKEVRNPPNDDMMNE
jgi:hypothetical protein